MILAKRLEVDIQHLPLAGPLEPPRELALPKCRRSFVATALDGLITDRYIGTDVVDSFGVEIDVRDRFGQLATLVADRIERHIVIAGLCLILGEHLAGGVSPAEDALDDRIKSAVLVEVGIREHLDVDTEPFGVGLQQRGEVSRIRVGLAEGVGDVGVWFPEVAAERAGVDLAESDDLAVAIGEFSREFAERIAVVAGEYLSHRVATISENLSDKVATHDLVDVAEVGNA